MNYWLLLLPLVSAFIGWMINHLAITLLFRPRKEISLLGIRIQGILPKQQRQLAGKLGSLVNEDLFSMDQLVSKISSPENLQQLTPFVENHIDHFLREKLAAEMPMISMFIGEKTINKLKDVFMTELTSLFPKLMNQYAGQLKENIDLQAMISEKIATIPPEKLEAMLRKQFASGFRYAKLAGAATGFIIGLVQVIIATLTA